MSKDPMGQELLDFKIFKVHINNSAITLYVTAKDIDEAQNIMSKIHIGPRKMINIGNGIYKCKTGEYTMETTPCDIPTTMEV